MRKVDEKKRISVGDRISYFYIRNIKKWMYCPSCKTGKMVFNKKSKLWTCMDCGYHFSEEYSWMIVCFGFVTNVEPI